MVVTSAIIPATVGIVGGIPMNGLKRRFNEHDEGKSD
nr:MAG TPA: Synapsin N-terminal [Caudoviricetes sp.]